MALPPVPNGLRITLEYTLNGKVVVNVYYAIKSTPIVTVDLTNVATAVLQWWRTFLKGGLSQDIALTKIRVQDVSVPDGGYIEQVVTSNNTGSVASQAMPNNVALVVSLQSGLSGRSRRGRTYVPGLPENEVSGSYVGQTFLQGFIDAYVELATALQLQLCSLAIVSFYGNGAPRAVPQITLVTRVAANTRIDTQRRRLPK